MTPTTNQMGSLSAALLEQEQNLREAVDSNDDTAIEEAADALLRTCVETLAELKRAEDLVTAYALVLATNRRGNA